ncbi:MAG: zeta toxin family protein [Steroidobacteraceae bacterium]|nr:zeta toxin family protein [Steroidobacteraceae bacterium]
MVIAGSNGAGKTTFYEAYLDAVPLPFVNSDRIAKQIAPDDPAHVAYEAARIADQVRRSLLDERRSFIMETVFSDPEGDELAFLREATDAGYAVVLLFVGINGSDLSVLRVQQRAAEGGHDVPIDKLQQRFPRTLANLAAAFEFVELALIIDNSSVDVPFRHVATWQHGGETFRAANPPHWCP